jgi:hypothetical protein
VCDAVDDSRPGGDPLGPGTPPPIGGSDDFDDDGRGAVEVTDVVDGCGLWVG